MYRIVAAIILTLFYLPIFGSDRVTIDSLDNYINKAIAGRYFPGAQLVIGNSEGVVYSKSYGFTDYNYTSPVDDDTLFDLASCTKVCATTLSIMTLIDEGRLTLDTRIDEVLNLADTLQFGDVKVKELLYHTSGFLSGVSVSLSLVKSAVEDQPALSRRRSDNNPYIYDTNYYAAREIVYDSLYISRDAGDNKFKISSQLYIDKSYLPKLDSMISAAYRPDRRGRHRYSDLNFYFLQKIVERVSETSLDDYAQQIYSKMNLSDIGYNPLQWSEMDRISPTEYEPLFRRDSIRGIVHDELACVQGGVAGNAGLFSSAKSVAQICAMFLRSGVDYNGNRIVDSMTLNRFTAPQRSYGSIYSLGFAKVDSEKLPYTPVSYGHTGYTGTFFWIDPTKNLYVVLLTNRVYPTRANKRFDSQYRGDIWRLSTEIFE